jgi:hypothetical protein
VSAGLEVVQTNPISLLIRLGAARGTLTFSVHRPGFLEARSSRFLGYCIRVRGRCPLDFFRYLFVPSGFPLEGAQPVGYGVPRSFRARAAAAL